MAAQAIRFDQRVAIVTGAGKGLGRAYAECLAARGARVIVNNRRRTTDMAGQCSADEVVRAIADAGGEAVASHDSVEDPGAGERLVRQALDTWGRLDVLINNAGVDQHRTFHKQTIRDFCDIFDVNFFGTLYVTHAAYGHMRDAGYGRIVVSTSSAGLHGRAAVVEGWGIGYTDARELGPERIAGDIERIIDMQGAREFTDAMASFNDFFQSHRGLA